jgi:signal transduction histidine kinase
MRRTLERTPERDPGEARELVRTGRLAALGELTAGAAHEINNPLFAILGLTEFLLNDAAPGSKAHQRLELIQQTGDELREIVRALLDFSRQPDDEVTIFPVGAAVDRAVELVRLTNAHKDVELFTAGDGFDTLVRGCPSQITQLFLHLLSAAKRAVEHGGSVRVDVRADGVDAVATVSPAEFDGRVEIGREIAAAHGGSLELDGNTFVLRLPALAGAR